MKAAIKWMAKNHVAANLLMFVLLAGGIVMAMSVKQEVFPEISMDSVQVSVVYSGAGPEEVEEGVVLKVEESLSGVVGIKKVTSVASEGRASIVAEAVIGTDIDLLTQEIKAEIDRITTLPEDAEKPVVSKLLRRTQVIYVVVYGDIPERSLHEYAEGISDDLRLLPAITQTELAGVRPYEISIDIPEERLRRYGLTLGAVAERIRTASVDLPAGSVKSKGGTVMVRTKEKRYSGAEYSDISIINRPDGTGVRLGDIADVRDTFRETDQFLSFDGKPAAMVAVFRVGEQKPIEISRAVKSYIEMKQAALPASVTLTTFDDKSELLKSRMNLLIKNALLGLVLVFIVLGLFLQIRLAGWVMLGIPISFLGAMLLMPGLDVSINMLSLFAFILALGIVVDDAIVVGENIFEHRKRREGYLTAAIDGAIEVSGPVVFSILTTIAAFTPLLFVDGMIGKFIRTIPLVVIPILIVSLFECLFILPSHLGHSSVEKEALGRPWLLTRIRLGFGARLDSFINGPYLRLLRLSLANRYATVAAAIAIFLIAIGIVGGGVVKFRFMPKVDGDFVMASVKMPIGTPVEQTRKVEALLVKKAEEVRDEYDAKRRDGNSILRNIYSMVGGSVVGPPGGSNGGSHMAEAALILTPSEVRNVSASEITNRWRTLVGEVPGVDTLTFSSNIVHFGANIDIQIAHDDSAVLVSASERIKEVLADYPGVGDIADNYTQGKRELTLKLKPDGRALGITEEGLARQVRSAFFGAEALRFQRGRDELRVMVRYPESERKSIGNLEGMRIRTPAGAEIPLTRVATIEAGRGYSEINRSERKKVINVTASVESTVANAEEIITELKSTLFAELAADYPGLSFDMEGEDKERRESMGSMKRGFLMALFAIYVLLAVPFRSYTQPLIIMAAIPFGLVGAVLGHLIMGYNLSILSMFGLVALSGVLINDALLLIDYINRKRHSGLGAEESIIEAGRRRFRPIILTSLTTSLGLTPMILETSVQAQFLIPMAISLGFGILFATAITLLLIPSLYLVLEDIRGVLRIGKSDKPDTERYEEGSDGVETMGGMDSEEE
ncbi:MAG: efflux RND transporter permease subunit [Proteobacteria bacterium]|nr:efflux RND transporter permease subunit [Pseudomonadota bacterium]